MAILTTGDEELLHIHVGKKRFHPLGGYSRNFHCLLEVHLQPLFWIIHLRKLVSTLLIIICCTKSPNPFFLTISQHLHSEFELSACQSPFLDSRELEG